MAPAHPAINNSDKGNGNTLLMSSRCYKITIKSPQYLNVLWHSIKMKGNMVF